MFIVAHVAPGSVAARKGVTPGDRILAIDGEPVRDAIDYQFLSAEERFSAVVESRLGRKRTLRISRRPDETVGITGEPFPVRRCRNNCIFCFVDQMPSGCRRSLYVKDDDFRASFLHGNYITLGNLTENDWARIFAQRLSPLYVSVHATDPALRSALLRRPQAPDIMEQLRRLAGGGILFHAQLVLCPGINDGNHLVRSLADLAGLYPSLQSIAVVPVGLTAHRRGRYPLRPYTRREATKVVGSVEAHGAVFRKKFGTRLVYASDEFYIKAGLPMPPYRTYEDFPQYENGVGMVATFLRDLSRTRLPARLPVRSVTLATGLSFAPYLRRAAEALRRVAGLSVRVLPVPNRFFGPTVTVTGLLTGGDILKAAAGKRLGSMLIISDSLLKDDEDVFLDDMRLGDLERKLGVPVRRAGSYPELIAAIKAGPEGGTS